MLYNYDKALVDKFKKVFPRVVYAPTDKFYERYLLENSNEKIELPAISIWRSSHEFDQYSATTQLRVPNSRILDIDNNVAYQKYSLKVALYYMVDIWASSDVDRDDLMKELLYFLVRYPSIYINYKEENFKFSVFIDPPEDTTDISNFENTGDLYRITIPVSIPDARLLFYETVDTARYINLSLFVNNDIN